MGLKVTPSLVQQICAAAVQDQCVHPEVLAIAKLGASGAYPANVRRQLFKKYAPRVRLPDPAQIDVPYIRRVDGKEVVDKTKYPVINPCGVLDALYETYPKCFHELLKVPPCHFWNKVAPDDPKLLKHPMLDMPDWQSKYLPVVLFGDHAPFTNHESLTVIMFKIITMEGPTWETIYACVLFPKGATAYQLKHGEDTFDVFYEYIVSFFNSAFLGFHALRDPRNQAWPPRSYEALKAEQQIAKGHFRLVVWVVTADLEYACNDLRCPHFNSMTCWHCNCTNLRELSRDALWRRALVSPDFN